jgi:archaellum component FlaC
MMTESETKKSKKPPLAQAVEISHRTSAEIKSQIEALERAIADIPVKRQALKREAIQLGDTSAIKAKLGAVDDLNNEQKSLEIQLLNARQELLDAERRESESSADELWQAVREARLELDKYVEDLRIAQKRKDEAERRLKTLAGKWQGVATLKIEFGQQAQALAQQKQAMEA